MNIQREIAKKTIISILQRIIETDKVNVTFDNEDLKINNFTSVKNDNCRNILVLSSLEIIDLVVEIENAFNINFNEREILGFETIGDLLDIINKYVPNI